MTDSHDPEPTYTPEQLTLAHNLCGPECLARNVRLVAEYIAINQRFIESMRLERLELEAHVTALDSNWSKTHEYAMTAFRMALEMPDAAIPDMLLRIAELKERAGIGVAHDGRICPCSVCAELRSDPPRLRVWYDDESTYAIAYSRTDLMIVLEPYDIEYTEDWYELAPYAIIKIKVHLSDSTIAPADAEDDPEITTVEMSAAEWIERQGRGFLCTSDY